MLATPEAKQSVRLKKKRRGKTQWWKEDIRLTGSSGVGPLSLFVVLQMGKLKQTRLDRSAAFQPIWLYQLGEEGKKVGKGWSWRVVRIKSKALMYPALHNSPHHAPIGLLFPAPRFLIHSISHAALCEKINQRGCKAGGEEESCVHGTGGLKVAKWHETRRRGGT